MPKKRGPVGPGGTVVRISQADHQRLTASAMRNNRTMTGEVGMRLNQSFDQDQVVDDHLAQRITNIEVMVRQIWLALEPKKK